MLRNLEKRGVNLDTLFILVYGIDCEGGEVAPKDVEVQSCKLLAFLETGDEPYDMKNNIQIFVESLIAGIRKYILKCNFVLHNLYFY